jgi:hypothetical protein
VLNPQPIAAHLDNIASINEHLNRAGLFSMSTTDEE